MPWVKSRQITGIIFPLHKMKRFEERHNHNLKQKMRETKKKKKKTGILAE